MTKILAFALAGALGGVVGAFVGEPLLTFLPKTMLGTLGSTAVWSAVIAVCISIALVIAQNLYLQRAVLTLGQATKTLLAGMLTGGIAGGVGEWLYGFASGRFANQTDIADGLAVFGGWLILGGLMGLGMSFFIANLPRSRAVLAGAIGGVMAAWLRLEMSRLGISFGPIEKETVVRVAGSTVLGLCLGGTVAWVDAAFREAWLDILYGSEKEKRTVRLGAEPVSVGSASGCTVYVANAQPVAFRYRFEKGNISCEDVAAARTMMVKPGDIRSLGKISVRVGVANQTAGATVSTPTTIKYLLRTHNGTVVDLQPEAILKTKDLPGADAPPEVILAEVARNPQNPSVLGLKNRTDRPWKAVLATGAEKLVEPGRSLALAAGNRVEVAGLRAEVQESFQIVSTGGSVRGQWITVLAAFIIVCLVGGRSWMVMASPRSEIAEKPPDVVAPDEPEPKAEEEPPPPPALEIPTPPEPPPVDPEPRIKLQIADREKEFGLMTTSGNPLDASDDNKRLTFNAAGTTNNTRLWIGEVSFRVLDLPYSRRKALDADGVYECEWIKDDISLVQTIQLIGGDVSRRTDAIQVKYQIANRGSSPRKVGLRIVLDTLIGNNDGVPFIVPGRTDLVKDPISFIGQDVPHFIQAVEVPDLSAPGVIVSLGLRAEGGEKPGRVELTHWPGMTPGWEYNKQIPFGNDTSVGLYYEPQELAPSATRTALFDYGLGYIPPPKDSKITITAAGPFKSGGDFYVTALVEAPVKDQTLELKLPPELKLKADAEAMKPVPYNDAYTQVSWLVSSEPSFFGDTEVKLALKSKGKDGTSKEVEEKFKYTIQPREARLQLRLPREPVTVGKQFWVSARVSNPRAGQALELQLPEGLTFAKGHSARKDVTPKGGERHLQVNWLVRATAPRTGRVTVKLTPDNAEDALEIKVNVGSLIGGN